MSVLIDSTSLKDLELIQQECAKKVIISDFPSQVELLGGMDVTFEDPVSSPTKAWASLVVIRATDLKLIYSRIIEEMVTFPYIPTFLAFRELPILLKLYRSSEVVPEVMLIDGQGIAHPRGCGVASHFGVETGAVTIGVAKTKLLGVYSEPKAKKGSVSHLFHKGRIIGAVLRTKDHCKPLFISIGHKITLEKAIDIVLMVSRYRIPEPLRLAHNLLKKFKMRKKGGIGNHACL